jgi:hypothetical protein
MTSTLNQTQVLVARRAVVVWRRGDVRITLRRWELCSNDIGVNDAT